MQQPLNTVQYRTKRKQMFMKDWREKLDTFYNLMGKRFCNIKKSNKNNEQTTISNNQ